MIWRTVVPSNASFGIAESFGPLKLHFSSEVLQVDTQVSAGGIGVGVTVGSGVGGTVGVGVAVGATVGVGVAVGSGVGVSVGTSVGTAVGALVGVTVDLVSDEFFVVTIIRTTAAITTRTASRLATIFLNSGDFSSYASS